MALIGQYRKKIKSAKNIAKLTKAMQLVAASKMKRAQVMAMSGKDYAVELMNLTGLLSLYIDKDLNALVGEPPNPDAPELMVLIAPQKGLCGGLVTNLTRFVAVKLKEENIKSPDVVTIGNKARLIARKLGLNIVADFDMELSYPKYDSVPPVSSIIEERFKNGSNSKVSVIYADFINTMLQLPRKRVLLPLNLSTVEGKVEEESEIMIKKDYIFEPNAPEIVNPLLEMYLEIEIYQLLLESYASEQSARMVAMKNATDNATGLISELTIDFNKARQASITNEILDIGNQMFINA